jgi:hypothetical protein
MCVTCLFDKQMWPNIQVYLCVSNQTWGIPYWKKFFTKRI